MKTKFIKVSNVRKLAKNNGRRISKGFIEALDMYVHAKITNCCLDNNGGRKTLDTGIAHYYMGKGI